MSRRRYHARRRPLVVFMQEERIFRAELDSYWESGLLLRLRTAGRLCPGDRLARVRVEKYGRTIPFPDLTVSQVLPAGERLLVSTGLAERQAPETIPGLIARLESPRHYNTDPATRLPYFGRKGHYSTEAVEGRRSWLAAVTRSKLEALFRTILQPESLAGNIENYIGAVQIPVGIAGPIMINGLYAQGVIPVTVATSEGALVASMTRGAMACNLAGGIQVHVLGQTMTRAPVFFCRDLSAALSLERWVNVHQDEIRRQAESVSAVARLQQITPFVFGDSLHIRFHYHTGDAAGQNMTTACTWMACRWIADQAGRLPEIGSLDFMIEGNLSGDKKVSLQNFAVGRGISVTATCRIPEDILRAKLGLTPETFCRRWQAGETGALQAGMCGSNINFANVVAAVFAATGQDLASIHESACGIFKTRTEDSHLVCTVYLPGLVIGTVGGGTWLPCQAECLEIMGCKGEGKVFRLAEIIAATCLSLDLSTGAAIASNRFARAHDQLGRRRAKTGIGFAQINTSFFRQMLPDGFGRIRGVTRLELDTTNAVLSAMVTNHRRRTVFGLHRYRLEFDRDHLDVVLKIKPHAGELLDIGVQVARMTGHDSLAGLFEAHFGIFGLEDSHLREVEMFQALTGHLPDIIPRIYGTCCDPRRDLYAVLMEDLSFCRFFTGNSLRDPMTDGDMRICLERLAKLHAAYWQGGNNSFRVPGSAALLEPHSLVAARELLASLTEFNARRFPRLLVPALRKRMLAFLERAEQYVAEMKKWGFTLTHNDCTPRNICLANRSRRGNDVIFYDWELACVQNPEHDLAEFFAFALPSDCHPRRRLDLQKYYYDCLTRHLGMDIGGRPTGRLLILNALHLALVRINLYLLGHNVMPLDFIEPVMASLEVMTAGPDYD